MDLGAGFEAIRPWLSTAFLGGILSLIVKLYLDNRKLRLAEKGRDQDYQLEVSADGRTNLQFIIDNLVRDIQAQRKAHDDCQSELERVRTAHHELETRHNGLQLQFVNYQITVARGIPPEARSAEITAMLKTLEDLVAESPNLYGVGGAAMAPQRQSDRAAKG